MRTTLFLFLIGTFVLTFPSAALADSPITSTHFSDAYMDIGTVRTADAEGIMTLEIAEYLADPSNPIDVKAAVINALSWDFDGKTNTEFFIYYLALKNQVLLDNFVIEDLGPEDRFCIGYLAIMDNYFEPQNGIPLLEEAADELDDSFTVAVILALAEAQVTLDTFEWGDIWTVFKDVYNDRKLDRDMREDAIDIIYDYMVLYEE